jgi:hypothetical protein
MMASQNAAISVLSDQSRYGIKPGTTIVRIVDGTEEVVLGDNALLIALILLTSIRGDFLEPILRRFVAIGYRHEHGDCRRPSEQKLKALANFHC